LASVVFLAINGMTAAVVTGGIITTVYLFTKK
jgi:hypothetical protein